MSKTNKKVIKMACNKEFLTFDKKTYHEELEGYIPKNEWEIIAVEATRVVGTAYHLRKKQENVQIPKFMNLVFWIMLGCSFVAFVFLIIYTKTESEKPALFYVGLILIILASAVIIVFMFYNYCRVLPEEEKLEYFIEKGMIDYLIELNNRYENIAHFVYNPTTIQIECTLLNKK